MKTTLLLTASLLMASALLAADAKDEITAAAKKLGEQANYSWKTTVTVPEGSRFRPGPTDGKTEKGGFTHITVTYGDNTTQVVMKGGKAALTTPEGDWKLASELENDQGAGRFMAMMVRNFKTPAVQAEELVAGAKALKKDGDVYVGEMTEETAKAQLQFRRGAGGDGPTATDAKGSAKFWLKEGVVTKFEYQVSGKVSFNGNDRDVDRTTTVEIKDVGATKLSVPEEAKKKLS